MVIFLILSFSVSLLSDSVQVGPGGNLPVTSPITLTVAGLPSQSQSSSRVPCQPTPTNSELKRATTVQPPSLSPQVRIALVVVCQTNAFFAHNLTFSHFVFLLTCMWHLWMSNGTQKALINI